MRLRLGLLGALLAAQIAGAEAPQSTLRPEARPGPVQTGQVMPLGEGLAQLQRAKPSAAPRPQTVIIPQSPARVRQTARPEPRPENLKRRAIVRQAGFPASQQPVQGSVCGNPAIRGKPLASIPGRIPGCGVAQPVRVSDVSGVRLSQPATLDCGTASALNSWVVQTAKPAVGRLGGGLTGLKVAAHYACRTRNNKKGAKVSEHGKGRAIDISALQLANGASITVLKGWRDGQHGPLMRRLHKGACGPFGTVLGPDADRFHQDHFHFDTARYRSGRYCR